MMSIEDYIRELKLRNIKSRNLSDEEYFAEQVRWYNDSVGKLDEVDGYNCDICRNKGDIAYIDDNGYDIHKPCKCQKVRMALRRAKRSGLGEVITEFTFDKYDAKDEWQRAIKTSAQQFCTDDDAKWFFIGGQVGSGKTHICTAISAHYIKQGYDVKYMVWAEEAKKMKAVVNDENYQDMIGEYKDVEVLYIDDFLKVRNGEKPTTGDINLAFEIINHRLLEKDKITIISSEKTLDEIMDYDEATMSRIYQKAGAYKFNIGKDRQKNYRLNGGV